MWVVLVYTLFVLLSPRVYSRQNAYAESKKSFQDLKSILRVAFEPIVNYVSSIEPPSQLELDLILEDLYDGITLRKTLIYLIAVYNPWTHLRAFKQGSSQNLDPIIVSVSVLILVFLFNKKQVFVSVLFLVYFLYVYAFKSITTLFYLYVTIFSPVLAVVAVLKEHTWIAGGSLLATYTTYLIVYRLFGKRKNKIVKPKKMHDSSNHSDVILARLNDLELRFNKICERLARLEKEQRRK